MATGEHSITTAFEADTQLTLPAAYSGGIEVVAARPGLRTFPARDSSSLGLCLKFGLVLSKRFVKKQQMSWSRRGAHLLLQVRTRVLMRNPREVRRMVSGIQCAVRGASASRIAPPLFFGLLTHRILTIAGAVYADEVFRSSLPCPRRRAPRVHFMQALRSE